MAGYIGSKASVVSSGAERKKTFAITTSTTSLTGLVYTPTKAHVFHNGVRLVDGTDYTATNGTSITLNSAAESGDEVVVISYAGFQTSDTVSASAGGTFSAPVTIDGNSATVLTVDRATTDGTIIDVQKGGSTVGSVGTSGSALTIHPNVSIGTGLWMDANHIEPTQNDGTRTDGTRDFGSSDYRWKDLYLSGGVYLGGTGSANKLDDYEEGTWTAGLSGGSVTNIGNTVYNKYTKVGNMVHLRGYVKFSGNSTSSGAVTINGLPFSVSSNSATVGSCFDRYGAGVPLAVYVPPNGSVIEFYEMGRNSVSTWNQASYAEVGAFDIHFSVTYEAA